MNDVARRAGVSYQTVSRVLNEHPSVAPDTRKRVMEAISALDYHPNHAARSLAGRQRSATLGVVSFGITYYGPAQMLANIDVAARERGYGLVFASIPRLRDRDIERALTELRRHSLAGLILIAPLEGVDPERVRAVSGGVPFVIVDAPRGSGAAGASIDQREGGRIAARHLIELGHERIACLRGPDPWHDARLRAEGWQETLAAAGLTAVAWAEGDWSSANGYAITHDLLGSGTVFTGLLVGNDQMALGALRALHERGIRVPGEVSMVGFDDVPESRYYYPPLTTVRQDFAALGRESLRLLLDTIESGSDEAGSPEASVIVPTLVVRASTGRPDATVERTNGFPGRD